MSKPSIRKFNTFWNEKTYHDSSIIYRLIEDNFLSNAGVDYVVMDPHKSLKPHFHELPSVVIFVVEGSGMAHLDGKEYPLEKGDVITIPPRIVHGFSTQDAPLSFLSIQTPAIYGEEADKDTYFVNPLNMPCD